MKVRAAAPVHAKTGYWTQLTFGVPASCALCLAVAAGQLIWLIEMSDAVRIPLTVSDESLAGKDEPLR